MSNIKQQLLTIPELSGSYQFYNKNNEIIYIGKAKNLKRRVSSYFNKHNESPKLKLMVPQIVKIEYIITDTEVEALILESHLIKKHKPKYNVLLKDDKKFPYFVFTDEEYPRIIVARKRNKNPIKGKYFGPYTDSRAMYATLDLIKRMFPLKQCKTPRFKNRPCIYYQIKRCSAPCQRLISPNEYQKILKNVELFLLGKQNELVNELKKQMEYHAEREEYEKAARYRDSYFDVQKTMERQKIVSENTTINQDIIATYIDDMLVAVTLIQIRNGRLTEKKDFEYQYFENISKTDVVLAFLREYYELNSELDIPKEIILDEMLPDDEKEIYEKWLSEKSTKKIKIKLAKNKKDKELSALAQKNVSVYVEKLKLNKLSELQNDYNEVGSYIQEKLNLKKFPHRVECFDISHIQGTNTVASMVVFENGMPQKSDYRKYIIRTVEEGKPDDFQSMKEVVERRYKRLVKENKPLPDLIIIDGGKGQLSSAVEILQNLGLENQDIVSLAKRLEEVFMPEKSEPAIFAQTSGALYFFQKIRDEAHRFAITFHRQKRAKSALKSKNDTKKSN